MVVFRFLTALAISLPILLGGVVFAGQSDSRLTGQMGSWATFRGEINYQTDGACPGMVALWPAGGRGIPSLERTNLVPAWVKEMDAECRFEIDVPPGNYYLQAVVRTTSGHALGPLRVGDLVFSAVSAGGEPLQVRGNAGDQIHLGTLATGVEFTGFSSQVETGISGRLIDENGFPVAGLKVLAFSDAEMLSSIYAVSSPSDEDGLFHLHLLASAEVYLQARVDLGIGPPPLGSLLGVYGDKVASPVKIEQGKPVTQVEIVVSPYVEDEEAGGK